MSRAEDDASWGRSVLEACRRIENAESTPTLGDLAAGLGVDGSTLQRQFRKRLGVSPRGYAQALRLDRLARGLAGSDNALASLLQAGFDSPSSGYAAARAALGTTPGKLRGALTLQTWLGLSELGWMLMAATERGICWLAFGDEPERLLEELQAAFPRAEVQPGETRLRTWFEQVREFILLPEAALDLPLDIRGTAFQAGVWEALREIPLGETRSYSEVARTLETPNAARAVASACARNKIALLIPCHRVVAVDGGLAGYRWGIERKAELLRREGRI
ncbi:MAG: methylated-DNA--[protein]-cysteine S-methyltransferase [Wenzhouxiangellaceae bacterium]|nr:methylated-DNA--[protein]-cysteine S-methyltransferase [Wenzhouxiangellaceae bacterium]